MSSMPQFDLATQKRNLRQHVLARRAAMTLQARLRDATTCTNTLLARPEVREAESVLSYMSFGDEIDTVLFNTALLAAGKRLLLPRIVQGAQSPTLALHAVTDLDALVTGPWGIREPMASVATVELSAAQFALIPGLAFDANGRRLGYGRGYYDRLLKTAAPRLVTAAMAFDCQFVERVPTDDDDVSIALLISPSTMFDHLSSFR
jgi:5-formyltetrahydrofolate cyclo-ligase